MEIVKIKIKKYQIIALEGNRTMRLVWRFTWPKVPLEVLEVRQFKLGEFDWTWLTWKLLEGFSNRESLLDSIRNSNH